MGNGNGDDSEKTTSSSLDFDVGLGLKMQPTESFPQTSNYGCGSGFVVDKVTCLSDIYDVVGGSGSLSAADAAVSPRPLYFHHPYITDNTSSFKSSGGGGGGKVLFTVSQWQELERQTMIYKYMMASIPVPHELILPFIKTPSHFPVTQSNTSGGSDLEPWRCKRTDGKKWRCSRDVAPDQKYCERHAHKSRPRSRKPVEIQSHTTTTTTAAAAAIVNSYPYQPPSNTPIQAFQKPISHFPTLISATPSYDQSRCIEWFMKGGANAIPVSASIQQWQQQQQLIQSSERMGLKRDHSDINKNVSVFQQQHEEEQEPMNLNSYMDNQNIHRFENQQFKNQSSSTTRHFIDAWSAADREDMNEINKRCYENSDTKRPLSSLSLSMNARNGIDEGLKSQWLSPVSWIDSPPGGPLGEALCLGIASGVKMASNVPSPHGYGNSNSTTTSSNSKSSCEDGGHVLSFIG